MTRFQSILVPGRGAAPADWLATALQARLHMLDAGSLRHRAVLEAVAEYDADLVVLEIVGATLQGSARRVARAVVESSEVPVLLVQAGETPALPWRRVIVPVSGRPEGDTALEFAAALADALDMDVVAAHVVDPDSGSDGLEWAARYADAPHHEYPNQLDEFVRRALPHCSAAERHVVREVVLCHGEPAVELHKLVALRDASLLVVGWDEHLFDDRSAVLDRLLSGVGCPVMIVKPAARLPFRLNVGDDVE